MLIYAASVLALMIFAWAVWVWGYYNEHGNILQKAILVIPFFKFLRICIYILYIQNCPW